MSKDQESRLQTITGQASTDILKQAKGPVLPVMSGRRITHIPEKMQQEDIDKHPKFPRHQQSQ